MARDLDQPCRARRPGSDALAGPEASRSATSSAAAGETADSRRSRSRALPASSSVAAGLGQRNSGGAQQRPRITRGEVDDRRQRVVVELPVGHASADERAGLIVRQVRQHHFDVEEASAGGRSRVARSRSVHVTAQRTGSPTARRAACRTGRTPRRARRCQATPPPVCVRGGREERCSGQSSVLSLAVRPREPSPSMSRAVTTSTSCCVVSAAPASIQSEATPCSPLQLPRYLAKHRGPT